MTLPEALNRVNFYLTIILSLSIILLYTGTALNFELIKEHVIAALILEIIFVILSSFVLFKIIEWCYSKKRPNFFFNHLKNKRINKCRDKFTDLFRQEGNNNDLIRGYIDNAINDVKSNTDKTKIFLALEQLLEWIDEEDEIQRYVLNELAGCIKNSLDEDVIHAILSVLCVYNRKINENI
jgi:hypothetical protein